MTDLEDLICAAEDRWLEYFTSGPTEPASQLLARGHDAPDAALPDENGTERRLSEFWASGPALIMLWRHFGCGCGIERASRLASELPAYRNAGLNVVVVGQGEPARAAAYKNRYSLDVPILTDETADVYRAYGVGHWQPEQVLFDAPVEYLEHPRELGEGMVASRREQNRRVVDDPWRASAEYVINEGGSVRLGYSFQYCEDFPDPRVFTAAARLAQLHGRG